MSDNDAVVVDIMAENPDAPTMNQILSKLTTPDRVIRGFWVWGDSPNCQHV